jgi:uncharacterized membrane protein YkoI
VEAGEDSRVCTRLEGGITSKIKLHLKRKEQAMRQSVVILGVFVLVLFIATSKVSAQEKAVPQDKIPKAVMDALLARFPNARIDKCTREKERGAIVYDIEFNEEGRKCEADIKENGSYINYEKAIDESGLPKAVSEAINRKYSRSSLKEIMEETEVKGKDEKLSAYEVVLETADKKEVEVKVSPRGKILEDTGPKKARTKKVTTS